jgi:pilus assembly protein CpaB
MRALFGLVLIVGLALAGGAVYMAQTYIGQTQALLDEERAFNAKAGKLVEVFVVNKAMKYGDPLTVDDVQAIYWPEQFLPETIFRDAVALFPPDAPGPRYVMRSIEPYEPVLSIRVTEPGKISGLTAKLAPGTRAFAIKVDVASGVSGFIQPDDFIDIYWTGVTSNSDGNVTQLIESSIQIIAVDNASDEGQAIANTVATTVTVAATPEQVARLAQAQNTGRLSMSLVGDAAATVTESVEVDSNSLLGIQDKVVEEVEAEKVCTNKVRKGGELVETVVPCAP